MKEVFKETIINITMEGKKHLGVAIGSREHLDEYVSEVSHWVSEVACSVGGVHFDAATGVLCCLHFRVKTPMDLLFKNTPGHPGPTIATGECNISGTYSCDNGTQL